MKPRYLFSFLQNKLLLYSVGQLFYLTAIISFATMLFGFVSFVCQSFLPFQIEDDATKFGRPLGVRTVSVIGGVSK